MAATGAIVPPNVTNIIAIAAGGRHNLALKADGTVIGWGDNGSGQISIPAGLSNVVAIAAGGYETYDANGAITAVFSYSLALADNGTIYGWGYNGHGETARGSTSPTNVYNATASSFSTR